MVYIKTFLLLSSLCNCIYNKRIYKKKITIVIKSKIPWDKHVKRNTQALYVENYNFFRYIRELTKFRDIRHSKKFNYEDVHSLQINLLSLSNKNYYEIVYGL